MSVRLQLKLDEHLGAVAARLEAWGREDILARVWAKDHTVWSPTPVPELTDRLGWLDLPERLSGQLAELVDFGRQLSAAGIEDVVVLGMGGSSLAPEVFAATFGSASGAPRLHVLDSTHPDAVLAIRDAVDLARTIFIVASKSGTTIEPLSFMEFFWEAVATVTSRPGDHFVATTDPGSELEKVAADRGFRRTFIAPPDVGGRYSALTSFGMVPAAAIGADLSAMRESAAAQRDANGREAMVAEAPGCRLGAAMGELALAGRDKITFITSPDIAALPAWVEQLIAESTGKDGKGIVPIGGEPVGAPEVYGADRFFVVIRTAESDPIDTAAFGNHPTATVTLDTTDDIAGAMYMFEMATALAGAVIGIQPFDQPDVQLAKELARDAMAGKLDLSDVVELDAMDDGLAEHIAGWLATARAGDYIGLQAFIDPTAAADALLREARLAVRDGTHLATTLDFGPRFLHSTGQLHKGGPNSGLFLEIVDHPRRDLPVPTTNYDFGELITGQALGDHLALRGRDRRVLLVSIGDAGIAGLQRVCRMLGEAAVTPR